MDKELKQLNKEIEDYVGDFRKADERIFNFGIRLGRILEKNNAEDYRLSFFSNQEAKESETEIKKNCIDSVNKIIQKIIGWAHKEQIKTSGSIHYEAGWRGKNAPLNETISKKYNITYSRIDQSNYGSDFNVYFMLNGKLKDIFEKHKVGIQVEASLCNSDGEDDEYITDEDYAETCFYSTSISLYPHNDNKTVGEIQAFAQDVEKFYTLFCLKLN